MFIVVCIFYSDHHEREWVLCCVRLFVTLWTLACKPPLSMGFSRQEYWSGLPCPPPGDLPDPGIKPASLRLLHWQVGSSPLHHQGSNHPSRMWNYTSFWFWFALPWWWMMLSYFSCVCLHFDYKYILESRQICNCRICSGGSSALGMSAVLS